MNDFFVTVGPNLAKEWDKHLWTYQGIYSNNDMLDIITDEREVLKLCTEIKTTKSSAIEGLNSKILKDAFMCLFRQLTHIFNSSFSTNVFPDEWKRTNVIPLPKDGDLTKCTNYRPISLLPLPGKLIEMIVHNRIKLFSKNSKSIMVTKSAMNS